MNKKKWNNNCKSFSLAAARSEIGGKKKLVDIKVKGGETARIVALLSLLIRKQLSGAVFTLLPIPFFYCERGGLRV